MITYRCESCGHSSTDPATWTPAQREVTGNMAMDGYSLLCRDCPRPVGRSKWWRIPCEANAAGCTCPWSCKAHPLCACPLPCEIHVQRLAYEPGEPALCSRASCTRRARRIGLCHLHATQEGAYS